MNYDITQLLQKWDYQPGQVAARRFKGKDGKDKVQLRVDLGILQMNALGRPDGKRPMGHETWFHFYRARWEKSRAGSPPEEPEESAESAEMGSEPGHEPGSEAPAEGGQFRLGPEDCSRLQQEAIQFHHRYICFYQLEDYDAVERDSARNLEVFDFVRAFAVNDELAWSVNQFAPQLFLMRTRAVANRALKSKKHSEAVRQIEMGINALEGFYRDFEREDLLDNSAEIGSLRNWLEEVRSRKPLTELEKLQRALAEAIQVEDYEKAAKVRDQLKKIRSPKS